MASSTLAWHQIKLNVKTGTLAFSKDKILAVVESVYNEYHKLIEPNSLKSDSILGLKINAASPYVTTQVNGDGEQIAVIYPVNSLHGNHIDQLVTKAVQSAIESDESLKNSIDGAPCVSNYSDL